MRRNNAVPVICGLLVSCVGVAAAQDLAEAARKAREDRANQQSPAARSYTEDDLAAKRADAPEPSSIAPPTPTPEAGATREDRPGDLTSRPPVRVRRGGAALRPDDSEEAHRARQEKYWRGRLDAARSRVERAEDRLARAARRAQRSLAGRGLEARRYQARAKGAVERAQEELDQARQALEDLPDEARKAGALPGWLR